MKTFAKLLSCMGLSLALAGSAMAEDAKPASVILITNAKIFDGVSERLIEGRSVLVEANKISKIGANLKAPKGATLIDAAGRTLTPGFIDAHYHLWACSADIRDFAGSNAPDLDYTGIVAGLEAGNTLMRGFTSLRDVGGASWGVKLAADRGQIPGPRVWPSLRTLSQFGGHGDSNPRYMAPRQFGGPENIMEVILDSRVVTGRDEMLAAVRQNLKQGASQIKMHLAGGVATEFDPIDGRQFTLDEIKAAVEVAEGFGTYVQAHVYTPDGIDQAIEGGVRSIEHGNLMSEANAIKMAKKGIWLSPQVLVYQDFTPDFGAARLAKGKMVAEGIDTMFKLAKKYKVKIAFGTDVVVNAKVCARQNQEFVYRTKWFTPAEVLKQATSGNGELLRMSGKRNPYPGKIGVIAEGAYADILLINGNPLQDISILTDPHKNLALIMKDGKIYKNTVK